MNHRHRLHPPVELAVPLVDERGRPRGRAGQGGEVAAHAPRAAHHQAHAGPGPVALVPVLSVPLAVLAGLAFRGPIERHTGEHMKESNEKNGLLIEAIDGIESIKAANAEWKMLERWRSMTATMADSELKMRMFSSLSSNLTQTIQQLSYASMIAAGAYAINSGQLTMGGLIAFRVVWGVLGTRYARFGSFVRGPSAVLRYLKSIAAKQPEHHLGHNPAGAVAIVLLMLMGLAAKNSILLVDYAIEEERAGKSQRDAIFEACRERARPIIMTTLAMMAGMLPTALGIGKGSEFRQPMAVAVIGGLITSTVLSLVLVPVVYEFVDDFENWLKPKLARLVTPREAPADRAKV